MDWEIELTNETYIMSRRKEQRIFQRQLYFRTSDPRCHDCGERDIRALVKGKGIVCRNCSARYKKGFLTKTRTCYRCNRTSDIRMYEAHHVAGCHVGDTVDLCLNCHAVATDEQRNWLSPLLDEGRNERMELIATIRGLIDLHFYKGKNKTNRFVFNWLRNEYLQMVEQKKDHPNGWSTSGVKHIG